jgi:hypothetical protein
MPIITCAVFAIIKKYKLMWTAALPSILHFAYYGTITWQDGSHSGLMLLLPMIKLISGCAWVLFAYIFIWAAKTIAKEKDPGHNVEFFTGV